MAFFVELPADKWNNTAFPRAVIEGTIQDGALIATAPENVVRHNPIRLNWYGGFVECAGPARELSHQEYLDQLRQVADQPRLE